MKKLFTIAALFTFIISLTSFTPSVNVNNNDLVKITTNNIGGTGATSAKPTM